MRLGLKYRSKEKELMDDLSLDSDDLRSTLHDIAGLNKFLGGHRSIRIGIQQTIKSMNLQKGQKLKIVEVGCGIGDNLNSIEKFFGNIFDLELLGIDANPSIIEYAKMKSISKNISFFTSHIDAHKIGELKADIVIFSLFLHHFDEDRIIGFLKNINTNNVDTIIISDLERSSISLILFKMIAAIFRLNKMAKYDGSLSIRKAFKTRELRSILKSSQYSLILFRRVFAFRHLAVLNNSNV